MNEWNVLIALFRATVEQTNYLNGQTQREAKLIFKRWQREGYRLLDLIEKNSDEDALEEITETIENAIHKLRKNEL